MKHRWPALTLALALLPGAARAQGEDFEPADASVTNTLILEARTQNENGQELDDNYIAIIERMNLTLSQGDFEGWARADAGFFIPFSELELHPGFEQNLRLERLGAAYTLGDWRLTAGDMFQQLGRGIVLAIRKVNEAGVDVALRGFGADYEGERVTAKMFVGITNPANIDSVNQRFVADPNDLIAGGSFELNATDEMRVGLFGAYTQPTETILEDTLDLSASTGAFLDAHSLLDWLTFYGEGSVQYRRLAGADQYGSALYGTADARLGDFGLLLEAMWLAGFEQRGSSNTALGNRFAYSIPPTLERIDQEVPNNRDVVGGRARAEYYFPEQDLLLYANGVYRINEIEGPKPVHTWHAFGGFQWTQQGGRSRLGGAFGKRDEAQLSEGLREPIRDMWNFDLDLLQGLGGAWSIHLTTQMQFWQFQGRPFDRGSQFVGIEKAGLGGLTFELGADTLNQSPGVRNLFYAGILTWEIPPAVFFQFVDSATLRATLGNQRGGIKCVAGVCREFPAFSGGRAEIVTRF